MANVHVEIERKYDVGTAVPVPPLDGIPGVAGQRTAQARELEAVYYDLEDFALLRHGITLRRRSGGTDAGWQVKIPAGRGRLEVHVPPADPDAGIPADVVALVRVHVRSLRLRPMARITTHRSVTVLLGPEGTPLAELCDDAVDSRERAGVSRSWREWEVELLDAARWPEKEQSALLENIGTRLLAAGAARAEGTVKLARALGGGPSSSPETGAEGTVRDVLTRTFLELAAQLKSWDPQVRLDNEDAIHQFRVSVRILRSLLRTYRPLLERERAQSLDERLRNVGRVLGNARDAEVMTGRIGQRIDLQPGQLIPQHVRKRLRHRAENESRTSRAAALRGLNSREYFGMLDALDEFTARLPLRRDDDGGSAAKQLARCARKQQHRVMGIAADALAERDPDARLELLHKVRKQSKRLRYAIRSVSRATGTEFGGKLGKSMKSAGKIQDALGTHRDSVMFQRYLATTARAANRAGENTFAYGILYQAEHQIQQEAVGAYEKALKKLR